MHISTYFSIAPLHHLAHKGFGSSAKLRHPWLVPLNITAPLPQRGMEAKDL